MEVNMYKHKIIKADDKAIWVLQKDWWGLCTIDNWKMYFRKKVPIHRKKPVKLKESDFYNKSYIKWACSYAFDVDFQELYLEWREERKLSTSYKNPFNEASEKRVFNKLNKVTKKIAMAMLDNAIENKWLVLYDLSEKDKEKIIMELRIKKWIESYDDTNKKIEKNKKQQQDILNYIKQNPNLYEEARNYVDEHSPNAEGIFKNTLIKTRVRMLARKAM